MMTDPKPPAGDSSARAPLRFAVMCSGVSINACWVEAVRRLQAATGAELALLIVDPAPPIRSSAMTELRKVLAFSDNLWHLHNRIFRLDAMAAHKQVPLAELGEGIPQRACQTTLRGEWSQHFHPDDIAYIQSLDLDFILKFAYGIIRGDIRTAARHGVWSFHHGDEQQFRGGPPAFWEIATDVPLQAAILQRLTERLYGGIILDKIWVLAEPLGYRRNLARIVAASLDMPAKAARALQHGRIERVAAAPLSTNARIHSAPTDREMVGFRARVAANYFHYKRENQVFERWNIGVVRAPISRFLDPHFRPEIEWAPYHRRGHGLADPFSLPEGEGLRVLCEEYSFFKERGWISDLFWNPRTGWGGVRTVLEQDVHVSYPYPVRHEGRIYCTPECGARNRLTLYRIEADRLVPERTILEGPRLIDSTIVEHRGRWWLFCTRADDEPNAKLNIFHAPSAIGPWTPHAGNPVKIDIRSSRPGGTPFVHEGRLYRPAQDCTVRYGGHMAINEVTRLSPDEFGEIPLRWIGPFTDAPRTHGFTRYIHPGNLRWSTLSGAVLTGRYCA